MGKSKNTLRKPNQIFQIHSPRPDPDADEQWQPAVFLVREVSLNVTSGSRNGAWDGTMTLLCFSPIDSNSVLLKAIEQELLEGEGELRRRIIGKPLSLKTLAIRRYLTAEDKELFGDDMADASESITAVITLGYYAERRRRDTPERF